MAWLFIAGLLVGPLFDGFHTYSGTTRYPVVWLLGMAWWTPIVFGMAVVVIGFSVQVIDRLLARKANIISLVSMIAALFFFGAVYFVSGFMPQAPIKYITLIVSALAIWSMFDRTWQGIFEGVAVGVVGTLVEILMIKEGLFYYSVPHLWGVPLWLPLLYFSASVALGNLSRFISQQRPAVC